MSHSLALALALTVSLSISTAVWKMLASRLKQVQFTTSILPLSFFTRSFSTLLIHQAYVTGKFGTWKVSLYLSRLTFKQLPRSGLFSQVEATSNSYRYRYRRFQSGTCEFVMLQSIAQPEAAEHYLHCSPSIWDFSSLSLQLVVCL